MGINVFAYPKFKAVDDSTQEPLVGGLLFTYEEGTSTKKTTYTTLDKAAANTNPIVLDANGEADVWIDGNYKFVLAPADDTDPPASPIWTVDAIRSIVDPSEASEGSSGSNLQDNGSFEIDTDVDGTPDDWVLSPYSGGTVEIDATTSSAGAQSLKFTSTGSGGGVANGDTFFEVEDSKYIYGYFDIISADADTLNKAQFYWYDASQTFLSSSDAYSDGATNPTSWTRKYFGVVAPSSAKFCKSVLTGVDVASTTHSSTTFDNLYVTNHPGIMFSGVTSEVTSSSAELNILDGATLDVNELNILDGATLDVAELNILDGATLDTTELNYVDGVTSNIQDQIDDLTGTWGLLEAWTPTAVNSKDFTWDESLYSSILVVGEGLAPATDDAILSGRLGYNDGGSFFAGSGDYAYAQHVGINGVTATSGVGGSGSYFPLSFDGALLGGDGVGTAASEGISFESTLFGLGSTVSRAGYDAKCSYDDNAGTQHSGNLNGIVADTAADTTVFDSFRILWSAGNFDVAGTIYIYGLKRA